MRLSVRNILTLLLAAILVSMSSCVSTRSRMLSQAEMEDARVVGSVTTKFKSFQWFHVPRSDAIADKAYNELMREAKRQFVGKRIDVVNIRTSGGLTGWMIFKIVFTYTWPLLIFGNGQNITAVGDVILLDGGLPDRGERTYAQPESAPAKTYAAPTLTSAGVDTRRLEKAIEKACVSVLRELPPGSKVAIASVTADNVKITSFAIDAIEFKMSSEKRFDIMDRSSLDAIRKEHGLQASGEFDEKTLVEFGRLSGADVIVVGNVMENRFSLKAMNGKTGKIITMARESY